MAINNPYVPGDPYSYDLKWMVDEVKKAQAVGTQAAASAKAAAASAEAAAASAEQSGDWEADARLYAQNAEASAGNAAASAEEAAGAIAPLAETVDAQGQQITVLEGRMDTFASLTQGSTTGDAELQDIRVAADGTVYPTAGDAVRGQIDVLKDLIGNLGQNGNFSLPSSAFARGGLNGDGTLTTQAYMASTPNDISFPFPVKIQLKSQEYSYYLLIKNADNTYSSYTAYSQIDGLVIDADTLFKVRVFKTGDFSSANLSVFANKVAFSTKSSALSQINYKNMQLMQADGSQLIPAYFNRGATNSQGVYTVNVSYRVSTPNQITFDRKVVIKADNGFRFGVITYGDSITDSGWVNSAIVKPNIPIRITIARIAADEDTSSFADVFEFYSAIHIQTAFYDSIAPTLLSAPIFSNGRAKLASHMGYHVNVPENTTAAFMEAGKLGYWSIESDLQQTSDGYYVMCHDDTVDRTTNGTGNIANMTLEQIRALHIAGRPELKIPTFEEYLSICKRYGCVPQVEIKGTVTNSKESYQRIIAIVKSFGFSDRAITFAGSKWAVEAFRQASKIIPFCVIYQSGLNYNWDTEFAFCSQYPNIIINWDITMGLTSSMITQAHAADVAICAFLCDTNTQVEEAFFVGADFCTTNVILPTD